LRSSFLFFIFYFHYNFLKLFSHSQNISILNFILFFYPSKFITNQHDIFLIYIYIYNFFFGSVGQVPTCWFLPCSSWIFVCFLSLHFFLFPTIFVSSDQIVNINYTIVYKFLISNVCKITVTKMLATPINIYPTVIIILFAW